MIAELQGKGIFEEKRHDGAYAGCKYYVFKIMLKISNNLSVQLRKTIHSMYQKPVTNRLG